MKTKPASGTQTNIISTLFVTLFLCAGCSSQPSAGDAERVIQQKIDSQSGGRIKLAGFTKTNGQKGELLGVQIYSLEYEAEIEFMEECKWIQEPFSQQVSFRTAVPPKQPDGGFRWDNFMDDRMNPGTVMKKGQRQKLKGSVDFEKTERGWRAAG